MQDLFTGAWMIGIGQSAEEKHGPRLARLFLFQSESDRTGSLARSPVTTEFSQTQPPHSPSRAMVKADFNVPPTSIVIKSSNLASAFDLDQTFFVSRVDSLIIELWRSCCRRALWINYEHCGYLRCRTWSSR